MEREQSVDGAIVSLVFDETFEMVSDFLKKYSQLYFVNLVFWDLKKKIPK